METSDPTHNVYNLCRRFWYQVIYYALSVDPTMLPDLNEISTCQSAPTQDIIDKCNQLLDYASIHLNTTIFYHESDMILMIDTDATYLVLP